jgi:hypothetical protein
MKSIRDKIVTLLEGVPFARWQGHYKVPEYIEGTWAKGSRVKVVMESRFWDIGITDDLEAENGYHARISPALVTWEGITPEERDELDERGRLHDLQMETFAARVSRNP